MPLEGGLYCFAWDVAERGVEEFVAWAKALGLNSLYMAGTYHAGWFLRPHAQSERAFMPADGTAYFHPDVKKYGAISPNVAPIAQNRDWLRETRAACERQGLELWSWTIGTHNTPLGLKHPEACVENAFGDLYPHALCPAHPEVRRYLVGLCADLSHNVGVTGIKLESFGYEGWKHGHHHERDLTGLTGVEPQLMGLCSSPSTQRAMRERGVPVEAVRDGVRGILDDAMQSAPDRPAGHPQTMEEVSARVPGLDDYMTARRDIVREVLRDICTSIAPQTRLWTGFDAAMQDVLTPQRLHSSISIYGQNAQDAHKSLSVARQALPGEYELHVGMRLGMGLPASEAEFGHIARAAAEAGAARLVFYNASESPRRMLEWIPSALAAANAEAKP